MTQDSPITRNISSLTEKLKEAFSALSPREKQLLLLGGILLTFVGLTVVLSGDKGDGTADSNSSSQAADESNSHTITVADIATPSKGMSDAETWSKNMQINYENMKRENEEVKNQNKILGDKVDVIDTLYRKSLKDGDPLNLTVGDNTNIERGDKQSGNQGEFREEPSGGQVNSSSSVKQPSHQQSGQTFPPYNTSDAPYREMPLQGIGSHTPYSSSSNLGEDPQSQRRGNMIYHAGNGGMSRMSLKKSDTYLPAGSHAKVALLSGVVAMTAVESQGNPLPIVLRVIDDGNLPRGFKSRIKNAQIIGACYGDISSERVYCRMETMSWVETDGTVVEKKIEGWLLGEDGRPGIRGEVVDRATDVARQSMIAGILGSMTSFLQMEATRSVYPVSPFGQTNALSGGDALKAGAAGGVGNALDKIAEFIIKRAEQMQPVIVVAAGRVGDVVFKTGVGVTPYDDGDVKMVSASESSSQSNMDNQNN